MNQLFNTIFSLKSLIIDNFNTSSVLDMDYLYNCRSLISINLSSFTINTEQHNWMLDYIYPYVKLCLDVKKPYSIKFLNIVSGFKINCTDICVNLKSKKFKMEENICVDDCLATKKFK